MWCRLCNHNPYVFSLWLETFKFFQLTFAHKQKVRSAKLASLWNCCCLFDIFKANSKWTISSLGVLKQLPTHFVIVFREQTRTRNTEQSMRNFHWWPRETTMQQTECKNETKRVSFSMDFWGTFTFCTTIHLNTWEMMIWWRVTHANFTCKYFVSILNSSIAKRATAVFGHEMNSIWTWLIFHEQK